MEKGQTIGIMYLTAGRMYYRQRGRIGVDLPSYLLNHHGQMAHVLEQRPIFAKLPPRSIYTWEELLVIPPPEHPPVVSSWQVICEVNSRWPYSIEAAPTITDQIHHTRDAREETFQRANTAATKEALGNPIATTAALAAVVIACVFVLLMALIFVQTRFSGDGGETVPGGSASQAPL